VVIVLAIGPKVRGFKPGRGRWILRAINIPSISFFEGKYSHRPHVVRFYGMLKNPAEYDRDSSSAKFSAISRQVSPCFDTRCLWWSLPEISGRWMIITRMGNAQWIIKWSQCMGHLLWYHPVTVSVSLWMTRVTILGDVYKYQFIHPTWVQIFKWCLSVLYVILVTYYYNKQYVRSICLTSCIAYWFQSGLLLVCEGDWWYVSFISGKRLEFFEWLHTLHLRGRETFWCMGFCFCIVTLP
jgi:hypothetical protein